MIHPIANWLTLDDSGMQMPWYTRTCLEWLDAMDLKGNVVFEYGVGNSTRWYRSRGANCYGVDSNKKWADFAAPFSSVFIADNEQDYIYEVYAPSNYVVSIDIVIIDGLYRDECTEHALKCLKPGGILIIDNWEQPSVEPNEWTQTKELIKDLKQTVYKEPSHPDWRTLVVEL